MVSLVPDLPPTLFLTTRGCSLTCPWCSRFCSCTRSHGADHGSSASRCSHGAHWHTHPQGGRTGRPRKPQTAHKSALEQKEVSLGGAMGMGQPLQHPDPTLRSPLSSPHPQIYLTFPGAAEASLQAAATTVLATPSTPATMGSPQAHGTLGCLGTAQGATLRPPEQPAAAPCHAAQRQVGGAQALWAREGHRSDVGIPPHKHASTGGRTDSGGAFLQLAPAFRA